MEFRYKNKTYDIVITDIGLRLYTQDQSFSKEEAIEVLKAFSIYNQVKNINGGITVKAAAVSSLKSKGV